MSTVTIAATDATTAATIGGRRLYYGTAVYCTSLSTCVISTRTAVVVDDKGVIAEVVEVDDIGALVVKHGINTQHITTLSPRQFLMPGFIDTHIHAPQYVFTGTACDLPLLQWLEKYTFPTEARFDNTAYAQKAFDKVVRRLLRNGTTTAAYFGTIHVPASEELVQVVDGYGQRALIGKVCMDQNAPSTYIETTEDSAAGTALFIDYVRKHNNPLIKPIITPRFAPSCTKELLTKLGDLAQSTNTHVQSHLAESLAECDWVKELFPESSSYASLYNDHGLLTQNTVMAHCIYLSDEDLAMMKCKGVGISHCPNSNTSIQSGIMNLREYLNQGMRVGLGTDAAGGYSPSMLDAMRQSINVSKINSLTYPELQPIDFREAIYLATLGGATALNMAETIGSFEAGKAFDAIVVDMSVENSPVDIFDEDTIEDIISKFVFNGDDRNITHVFVQGRDVTPLRGSGKK